MIKVEYATSTNNLSNLGYGLDDVSGKMNTCINSTTSPKKDTAVQTGICLKLVIWFKIYLKLMSQLELSSI